LNERERARETKYLDRADACTQPFATSQECFYSISSSCAFLSLTECALDKIQKSTNTFVRASLTSSSAAALRSLLLYFRLHRYVLNLESESGKGKRERESKFISIAQPITKEIPANYLRPPRHSFFLQQHTQLVHFLIIKMPISLTHRASSH
jgi:hypothetical protein